LKKGRRRFFFKKKNTEEVEEIGRKEFSSAKLDE
jgi:hypothetical protein